MKVVIDGKVYDTTKTPILVVLDTADIQSVWDLTRGPLEKPLNFFECPEALGDTEMDDLCEKWKDLVQKYERDERLQGNLPYTATIPSGKAQAFLDALPSIDWIKCVDMQHGKHDYKFCLHVSPDAKLLALEDFVVRDYGGTLLSGEDSDRPVLPSGTVVEYKLHDSQAAIDKALKSLQRSDAMAAFLDEILLQGMTCQHCGHKGLVRREDA